MKKDWELSQAQFDSLLGWLSEDREKAGEKYLEIRESLVRFFELKGSADAETLADETINRLTAKLCTLKLHAENKPITVFFGFAKNVYLESLRQKENQLDPVLHKFAQQTTDDKSNVYLEYLDECLENYPVSEREFIFEYYAKEKSEKFNQRRKLAEKLKIAQGTMNARIHRMRLSLQKCIESKINL